MIQVTLKYSVVTYGHLALLLGLSYFIGNILNHRLLSIYAPLHIALFAAVMALFSSLGMIILNIFFKLNIYVVIIPVWIIFFLSSLIIPNTQAKIASLFQNIAGTSSAVMGFLAIGGVFVISSLASLAETQTQFPMILMFFGIILCSILLLFWSQQIKSA